MHVPRICKAAIFDLFNRFVYCSELNFQTINIVLQQRFLAHMDEAIVSCKNEVGVLLELVKLVLINS